MTGPRVRFAPAPTGYLHVGGARTALFNWIYARHTGGTFVLRIEDTDPERSRQELVDVVLRTMEWLGLDWDEGPYRQSERAHLYLEAVQRLLDSGTAYRCDCTREQIDERTRELQTPGYDSFCRDREVGPGPGVAVRFRTPDDGATVFTDVVRGEVRVEHSVLEDFVVQRGDGSPTFFVANAVDDADMGITHAIRGEDLLNTVPRVMLLWRALGYGPPPVYAHLPLLVNEQRQKLSKRRHDVAVEEYRDRGFLPEALVNYLALMGWGPPDGVEIRPIDDIVRQFRLEDVTKAPAFFDVKKLEHFNGEYIRMLPVDEFVRRSEPFFDRTADERFTALAPLVQERVRMLSEVGSMVDFVFLDEPEVDEASWDKAMARNEQAVPLLDAVVAAFGSCDWSADALHAALAEIGERFGLKLAKAQAPVRVAVTGRTVGPPLFESLVVLGRDRTLSRLRAARDRLGR